MGPLFCSAPGPLASPPHWVAVGGRQGRRIPHTWLSGLVLTESAGESLLTVETLARLFVSRERRSQRGGCRPSARAPALGARALSVCRLRCPWSAPGAPPRCPKASGDVRRRFPVPATPWWCVRGAEVQSVREAPRLRERVPRRPSGGPVGGLTTDCRRRPYVALDGMCLRFALCRMSPVRQSEEPEAAQAFMAPTANAQFSPCSPQSWPLKTPLQAHGGVVGTSCPR